MGGDRCSGACCREFVLSFGNTPAEVDAFLRERGGPEGAQIADMIVPIRAIEVGTVLPNGRVADTAGGVMFTCRHHDPETGDCQAYEARPRYMCGAYPYGKPCEHGDRCTWTLGRGGFWPLSFHHWSDGTDGFGRHTHLKVVQPGGEPDQRAGLRGAPEFVTRAVEDDVSRAAE